MATEDQTEVKNTPFSSSSFTFIQQYNDQCKIKYVGPFIIPANCVTVLVLLISASVSKGTILRSNDVYCLL